MGIDRKLDAVQNPLHYNQHPSGVECITITEHMNFNLGNATKYIWRASLKGNLVEDLEKAAWYVAREIERIKKMQKAEHADQTGKQKPLSEGLEFALSVHQVLSCEESVRMVPRFESPAAPSDR
jgi:hypothetical protein